MSALAHGRTTGYLDPPVHAGSTHEATMKNVLALVLGAFLLAAFPAAQAQSTRPYQDGPVTIVSSIKIKPGRFDDYMKFLATDYKKLMEAYKKEGLVVNYAVYSATAHTPQEPDMYLTVSFPNMAALDKTDAFESVSKNVIGSQDQQSKGTMERGVMREVIGEQTIRQLILK